MANFKQGIDRGQLVLFPLAIDDMISSDNEVRLIDAFVDKLDLSSLGFANSIPNPMGTSPFNPKDFLKLYLYGYKNKIRSSRKLMHACEINVEVIWLMKGLKPDFRTISDFRKNNAKQMKEVFKQLVIICNNLDLIGDEHSQDGTKIKAVNSKEKNFTLNKIDDRLSRIEKNLHEYLKQMDELDRVEHNNQNKDLKLPDKDELETRINKYNQEKEKLESYRKQMEQENKSQISLTDSESKLMKNNGKFDVAYNTQVLVDSKSHLVTNFDANDNPADVGTMEKIAKETKELLNKDIISDITDKGYNDKEDMANCLEQGIIPQVTLAKGKDSFEVSFDYTESEVTEEMKKSTNKEDIKTCLKAGVVPEVYEDYLELVEIKEQTKNITDEEVVNNELSDEELRDFAIKNNCFMKSKDGKVFCPMGEILRKKSKHKQGDKYCNKMACKNCKNPCTMARFKEVTMRKNQIISTSDKELKQRFKTKKKSKKVKIKKVVYKLRPKEEALIKRMGTSEHCHGTMKVTDNFDYFLLKGKIKVNAELALYYTASNLRRIKNIMGVEKAIELINGLTLFFYLKMVSK